MEILEAVVIGAELLQGTLGIGGHIRKMIPYRQCKIDIMNNSTRYILQNPGAYTVGGTYNNPLSPRVRLSSSDTAVVLKTPYTGRGFSSVFSYDLLDNSTGETSEQLAVYFKVPYDTNMRKNEYAMASFEPGRVCDKNLYEDLAVKTDLMMVRGRAQDPPLTLPCKNITVRATMSEIHSPLIKVYLDDE